MAYSSVEVPRTFRQAMGGPYGALWVVVAAMCALVLAGAIYGLVRSQIDARRAREPVPASEVLEADDLDLPFGRPNRVP